MGIPIPGKTRRYIETGPCLFNAKSLPEPCWYNVNWAIRIQSAKLESKHTTLIDGYIW